MEDYLQRKNIAPILKDVVVQLCLTKPENPVQFMVDYLSSKHLLSSSHSATRNTFSLPIDEPIEASDPVEKEADFKSPRRIESSDFRSPRSIASSSNELRLSGTRRLSSSGEYIRYKKSVESSESTASSSPVTLHEPLGHVESQEEIQSPSSVSKIPVGRRERRHAISAEPITGNDASAVELPKYPKNKEQQDRLTGALSKHIMFAHLEEREKQDVFDAMFEVKFTKGDTIIRQGDEGDNFYVVEDGECDIYVNRDSHPQHVAVVGKDGSFGELALIYGSPRAATVVAKSNVVLWAIDRASYRQILMKSTIDKRKVYEAFLEKVPILSQLNSWERMVIADSLETFTFQDGEVIVREGEEGDRFYIILEGEAEVLQNHDNGQEQISTLHKSDYFGEVALLTNRPRAATVVAVGTLKTVGLDRDRFNRVLGPCENILRRNMENYNRYMADKI